MHDTDALSPTDPPRPIATGPATRRPARSGWLAMLLVVGIAAGVGTAAVRDGDDGFTAPIRDAVTALPVPR